MSMESLLKNRNNNDKKLREGVEKLSKGQSFEKDARFWQPTLDAAGNASALIRFLLPPEQDIPKNEEGEFQYDKMEYFVKTLSHGFKGPTGLWYIEESPKTVGFPCPVVEYNTPLWATGLETDKKKIKATRTLYISNILIVKDPSNPSNNGRVFLFKYGKKIYDKIIAMINPDEAFDMKSINPFDPMHGANFRYRRRKEDDFPNYDLSAFDNPSAIGSVAEIEEIWKKEYSLKEFVNPSNFKSYEELKGKFNKVMGLSGVNLSESISSKIVPISVKAAPVEKTESPAWDSDAVEDAELHSFQALLNE